MRGCRTVTVRQPLDILILFIERNASNLRLAGANVKERKDANSQCYIPRLDMTEP